jgi:hypothetical protein
MALPTYFASKKFAKRSEREETPDSIPVRWSMTNVSDRRSALAVRWPERLATYS